MKISIKFQVLFSTRAHVSYLYRWDSKFFSFLSRRINVEVILNLSPSHQRQQLLERHLSGLPVKRELLSHSCNCVDAYKFWEYNAHLLC